MKRKPAVAGQFYAASSSALSKEVQKYIEISSKKERAIGVVSPHAGLIYSGAVAGAVFSRIEFPHTFILIGPNHTGMGKPLSIMAHGEWEIPTGNIKIDEVLAEKILKCSQIIEQDTFAHSMEHSLEVQLPFVRCFSSDVQIVPITMMTDSLESCRSAGETIADAVKGSEYPVTIVASSDMSHYEADSIARAKDKKAIDKILSLDARGLYETVKKDAISMCGYIPTATMLFAAQTLGAKNGSMVKYMTSGEVSGDYGYVVGYAGIIIK
ncbi:MAG: AmmeMemoRadiSam system protein B [Thermodesulfovibrionia bacterium]|nr:AmmeMemoRadiSam system protein B [Thermodesulfovibrionia bacterium]